jgi:hypothetical protein
LNLSSLIIINIPAVAIKANARIDDEITIVVAE